MGDFFQVGTFPKYSMLQINDYIFLLSDQINFALYIWEEFHNDLEVS